MFKASPYILALFILFLSFAHINAAYSAQSKVGTLIGVQGDVFQIEGETRTQVTEGAPVFLNTRFETNEASKALILFIDNTELTLSENTSMIIDDYVFDAQDRQSSKASLSIEGTFIWLSGLIGNKVKPDVNINTSIGTIGIRGTEFWSGQINDQFGVFVASGIVNYKNQVDSVTLGEGEGVFTKSETQKLSINKWSQANIDIAQATIRFPNHILMKDKIAKLKSDNAKRISTQTHKSIQRGVNP